MNNWPDISKVKKLLKQPELSDEGKQASEWYVKYHKFIGLGHEDWERVATPHQIRLNRLIEYYKIT